MNSFKESLPSAQKERIEELENIVLRNDPRVSVKTGKIMKDENCIIFLEEDVLKYGIAKTKKGFTFHSIILYAYPEVAKNLKGKHHSIEFKKGCFNFYLEPDFPFDSFDIFLKENASKDFTPILKRYKK